MTLVNSETGEIPTHSPTPYQLMPGLTDEERGSLRLDIEKHGIRVPIDVDEDDNILDGHHRAWIAAELGIPCPRRLVAGLTVEQKRAHAVSVNVFRRNLTRDQRRELVARLRADGMSTRAIAEATRLPHRTVARDAEGVPTGTTDGTVTGNDGKTYKATKPKADDRPVSPMGEPDDQQSPCALTAEEQAEEDRKGQVRRAAQRLEQFVTGWLTFDGLRSNPDRDEILALLNESDRRAVLDIEASIERQERAA